jgi:membrane-associated protease RseP (regulator of RpoE activity)
MISQIITRKALIDIGASGPIAGFILSVIASVVGLHYSTVLPLSQAEGFIIDLGDSLLFTLLSEIVIGKVPDAYQIMLHPVAFAGWIGLFVTSLNLIPIGQLDGGHISYAFLGKYHAILSRILVVFLLLMGLVGLVQALPVTLAQPIDAAVLLAKSAPHFWVGWMLWGVIMLALGLKHPPVIYWEVPLDRKRRYAGVLALVIFILTFTPSPFTFAD